ncbi:hypothetical protein EVAR_73282_1 [Eumeta japonica]|uniref:Uncharacterized protein n=1 Tax=Eumeta variegata TaxID=151549 RepID=A0A4C1TQ69_EUMVA|nr:hypothetical protein EVAR_73282_1 [Eumeta japonica]
MKSKVLTATRGNSISIPSIPRAFLGLRFVLHFVPHETQKSLDEELRNPEYFLVYGHKPNEQALFSEAGRHSHLDFFQKILALYQMNMEKGFTKTCYTLKGDTMENPLKECLQIFVGRYGGKLPLIV